MANGTQEDRGELERLIAQYFQQQGEPQPGDLVATLACVGMGYLAGSFGTFPPVSRATERDQLAGFLGGTYLQGTRPSPNNNYLQIVTASGQSHLRQINPDPPVSPSVVTILGTLGMGFTRETDPRATRAAATNHFIDLYLAGR